MSRARIICDDDDMSLVVLCFGCVNTAKTGDGVFSVEIFLISSLESAMIISA